MDDQLITHCLQIKSSKTIQLAGQSWVENHGWIGLKGPFRKENSRCFFHKNGRKSWKNKQHAYFPENERMSLEKGPVLKETSSSNHQFSGNILVFRGTILNLWPKIEICVTFPFEKTRGIKLSWQMHMLASLVTSQGISVKGEKGCKSGGCFQK